MAGRGPIQASMLTAPPEQRGPPMCTGARSDGECWTSLARERRPQTKSYLEGLMCSFPWVWVCASEETSCARDDRRVDHRTVEGGDGVLA